jgi:hypothetical protein
MATRNVSSTQLGGLLGEVRSAESAASATEVPRQETDVFIPRQLNVTIDSRLYQRLRREAFDTDQTMMAIVSRALERELA